MTYFVLVQTLLRAQPDDAPLATAIGRDAKGKLSPVLYAVAIPIALVAPLVAFGIYVFVALIWIVPDTRIERRSPTDDQRRSRPPVGSRGSAPRCGGGVPADADHEIRIRLVALDIRADERAGGRQL